MLVDRVYKFFADTIANWLSKHPDYLVAGGVGYFLATKYGKALISSAVKKGIPLLAQLTKAGTKATAKAIAELMNDYISKAVTGMNPEQIESQLGLLGSQNPGKDVVTKIGDTASKVSKVTSKSAIAGTVAGACIGSYLGYTISSFKGYKKQTWYDNKIMRVIFPAVYATVDPIVNHIESKKEKAKSQAKTQAQLEGEKRVAANKRARSHPMTKQNFSVQEYEQEAEGYDMGPAPTNPTAYNAWKKEVEMRRKNKEVYQKTKTSKINDKSWYNQGDASKISAGTLTWSDVKTNAVTGTLKPVAVATAVVALTMPMEGTRLHPRVKQNINVLFQALRGKNTGAFNYEEEDVFNYVYALSSLIARIRFIQKILRLANTHNVLVDNLHVGLTDACFPMAATGVIYNEIIANAPTYISRINSLVEEINTYALPGNTLISRWNYIADKAFRDYAGKQAVYGFYRLGEVPRFQINATRISDRNLANYATFAAMLTDLETDVHIFRRLGLAATPAVESNVMVKISGDMIKLLGANASTFRNADYYTGNPAQVFEYDVEAIDQLRNAKIFTLQSTPRFVSYNITGNWLMQLTLASTSNAIDNFVNADPTLHDYTLTSERDIAVSGPENVQLVQFFWNASYTTEPSTSGGAYNNRANVLLEDCSVTVITEVDAYYYTVGARTFTRIQYLQYNSVGSNRINVSYYGTNTSTSNTGDRMQIFAQIDFVPRPVLYTDSATPTCLGQSTDLDNYCNITSGQFNLLNNVAAYSLTFYWHPDQLNINGII